ncbi:hypothetical protein [Companilactobacillus sp.]|uniref:hypothetical protein n=1 Tax=Companilactobacillus sp. TaxID=2767905 RepID=UPI0026362ADF|nr:hypothetical protein [Companilactobacillus sp.]
MTAKKPAWHAYKEAVISFIPRLKGGSDELEHRARLLWIRDHANAEREKAAWWDDQILHSIISLVTAYGLSTRLRPEQVKALWEVTADMGSLVAKLRALDLS